MADPRHMAGFVNNGIHALDGIKDIPSVMFKEGAGIIVLSAKEIGFVFSGQAGSGVALKNKGGSWSNPVAVTIKGAGAGASFGYADKDMLIVLNPAAMDRLLQGHGQMKLGEDLGIVAGKYGGNAGADIAASDHAGFGTSFVYTASNGVMLTVQAETCWIGNVSKVNKEFYGTDDVKKILEGDVKVPDGDALVSNLYAAIKKHE